MGDFRFSFSIFGTGSRDEFHALCRHAERIGYTTVYVSDHLGGTAPFPTLVAAADATDRLRVGTLVLNTGFWNSHLLAREVAAVDKLTDGRFDLGLGSGHMRWEYDAAGIDWLPLTERTDQLVATVDDLTALFSSSGYPQQVDGRLGQGEPLTVQRRGFGGYGPPLLIGGSSDRMLQLAAERADIVGFSGVRQLPGAAAGVLRLCTAADTSRHISLVHRHAADRVDEQQRQALVQAVQITPDRRGVAEKLVSAQLSYLTVEELLDNPFLLIGTVEQIAEQVREQRERFGFDHYCVHDPYLTALAPVIERLG